jgi:hypothetical protein
MSISPSEPVLCTGACERSSSFLSTRVVLCLIITGGLALIVGIVFSYFLLTRARAREPAPEASPGSDDEPRTESLGPAPYAPPAQGLAGDEEPPRWRAKATAPPQPSAGADPPNPYDEATV